jgi:uncharacterized iron-regulated protein
MFLVSCARTPIRVYDLRHDREIHPQSLPQKISTPITIVLSEQHYQPSIQKTQAEVIRSIVQHHNLQGKFSVGWEFLDFTDQDLIDDLTSQWGEGIIDDETFIRKLFPSAKSSEKNRIYLPILRAVRDFEGQLLGVNAPRDWKKIVTSQGLGGLETHQMPSQCNSSQNNYRDRFFEVMSDHIQQATLERYFEAQLYTDCTIANILTNKSKHDLKFLIIGSFHADFGDGVVPQLGSAVTIKLIQGKDDELLIPHPRYGKISDFVYITE